MKQNSKQINHRNNIIYSKEVVLLDGRQFKIHSSNKQKIYEEHVGNLQFNLNYLNFVNGFHHSIFLALCDRLSTHSLKYCQTISIAFRRFFELIDNNEIRKLELKDLNKLLDIQNYIPFITPIIRQLANKKCEHLSDSVIDFIKNSTKWEERKKGSYIGLISNDPERGALTEQEMRNLTQALNKAYQQTKISLEDFCLCWMFIALGLRPIQLARMSRKDIQISKGPEGSEVTLSIPLAKGERTISNEYWLRRAPTLLAECLIPYLEITNKKFSNNTQLFEGTSIYLGSRLTQIFSLLDTWSDRLEGKIPVFSYRFRYTLATRAIRAGASDWEVARLLTHRRTTSISFYRASMPELQEPIKNAVGEEMDFFSRAFQGKRIKNIGEATNANSKESLIMDFLNFDGQSFGACATKTNCYQNAPISCVTCPFFEAFNDAPWEEMKSKILSESVNEQEPKIREIHINTLSALNELINESKG